MSNSLSSGTGFAELAIGAIAEGRDLSSEVVVEDFPKLNLGILNILVLGSPVESLVEDEDDFKWNFAKSFSSVKVCGFSATDGVGVAESYLSVSGSKAGYESGHERDEETFH